MMSEKTITWLKDPMNYPYLREGPYMCGRANGRPKGAANKRRIDGVTVIGWETPVKVETPAGTYWEGRYWWLKAHDPYWEPGPPLEAVLPSSIRPGLESIELRDLPDQGKGLGKS